LLCAEIGVDAAGDDDAAVAAGAQQVEALLGEELVEVDVRSGLPAVNDTDLILVLRGRTEESADMRIPAEVFQPSGTDIGILEELGLLLLELLDRHLLLADQIGNPRKLLGIGLEDFPRRIGDDRVKAARTRIRSNS
jgi:hypothetical protein